MLAGEEKQLIETELTRIKAAKGFRHIRSQRPIDSTHVAIEGKTYLVMNSNNYLGLTDCLHVRESAIQAIHQYGTGSGGARLTSGNNPLYEELEAALADFKGTEAALVFNTGYMANVGIISSLIGKEGYIFSDALNHASIIDGCRLSRGTTRVFAHKDMGQLERLLEEVPVEVPKLIVSDGVFSMDGDLAPVSDICDLAGKYNALVMIDDAHATGVIAGGRGTAHAFNCQKRVDLQVGTLSKALASEGGFVATSQKFRDYLVNKARSFIFSTALSPATIGAALGSLIELKEHPEVQKRLVRNQVFMEKLLHNRGIACQTESPIFPILVGSNERALQLADYMYDRGILLSAIRPPTVPEGQSRLRLTVTAAHTEEELAQVADVLSEGLQAFSSKKEV